MIVVFVVTIFYPRNELQNASIMSEKGVPSDEGLILKWDQWDQESF